MLTINFPRLVAWTALIAAFFIPVSLKAQTGSSAREIPTEIQKTDALGEQVIARAEDHFMRGKADLDENKREQARAEFDRAVDTILEFGFDVRANQRLKTYYLELVERIYREEVPMIPPSPQEKTIPVVAQNPPNAQTELAATTRKTQEPARSRVGFHEQKFEPSPLDELSKLILTPEEQNVSPSDVESLEQAKNSVNFDFSINPLIQQYINYYQGRGRSTMETGLRRSGRFMKLARETFRKEGVPEDLAWLGQVESAWTPRALSRAAASGLWQFVPSAGRAFGLRQTAWIDERNSFEKATQASARYLKVLGGHYNNNWLLAMAAYNTGQANVDRAVSRAGAANFWQIYPYIALETRNYVPNILATILIAKNRDKYGFQGARPEPTLSYDVVELPTATSLRLIADATDTSVEHIQSLNPELRRDVTPRGEVYRVRVPNGKSKQLVTLLKRIPRERYESARIISVAPGEDLQSVANRTGSSVAALQAMNSGVDLKTATKLIAPSGSVRATIYSRAKRGTEETAAPPGLEKIRARRGDTIARIAAAHKLSVDEVARLNGLAPDVELQPGQEIRLPSAAASSAPTRRRHR